MRSKQQKPYVVLSTNRPVIVHALRYVDNLSFCHCGAGVRWTPAPTEPAGETAVRCVAIRLFVIASTARCAAIRFSLKGYLRILSCCALRMTNHLVIAKPCKRLWQSVPFSFTTTKNTDPSTAD